MSQEPEPFADAASRPGRATATVQITLDDLIALNDEMAALVRAGVPLERGLAGLAGELPGRLAVISRTLATRLSQGQSLPDALTAERQAFPPAYAALVAAGLRSGRLAAALEGLSAAAVRLRDVRQTMLFALAYPLAMAILACGLLVLLVCYVEPRMELLYDRHVPARLRALALVGDYAAVWGVLVPVGLALLFAVWWYRSNRALVLQAGESRRVLGWLPGVGRLIATAQAAALAEILALLLEHDVPLAEAVVLAAEAVGDRATRGAAAALAAAIQQGTAPPPPGAAAGGLAPLVRWLICAARASECSCRWYAMRPRPTGSAPCGKPTGCGFICRPC